MSLPTMPGDDVAAQSRDGWGERDRDIKYSPADAFNYDMLYIEGPSM